MDDYNFGFDPFYGEGAGYDVPISLPQDYTGDPFYGEGAGYGTVDDQGNYVLQTQEGPVVYDPRKPDTWGLNVSSSSGEDSIWSKLFGQGKGQAGGLSGLAQSKGGFAALMALLAAMDRQKATGGGTARRYAGPAPLTRTIQQGKYGPIARYADGGKVQMEDGGFVMTKRAVDGAGGHSGLKALLPEAKLIRGPGTGTSDSIPAVIKGRNKTVPAKVSNGEAYVPREEVRRQGGAQQLYALMHKLERKA